MAKINEITKEQIECIKIFAWVIQFWVEGFKDSKHWNQLDVTNLVDNDKLKDCEIVILTYIDRLENKIVSRKQFAKLVNYVIDHLGIPYRIAGQDEVRIARGLNMMLVRKNASYKNICSNIMRNKFFNKQKLKKYNK